LDPIVDSGGVAKHVHNVCGGSSFGRKSLMLLRVVSCIMADGYPFFPYNTCL
jgi:hypothetical protein